MCKIVTCTWVLEGHSHFRSNSEQKKELNLLNLYGFITVQTSLIYILFKYIDLILLSQDNNYVP